ncbi:MAG: oligosaccharide flippase family protein, partial [Pseudomonadota bacterium]|nr:oligosaccharide flippase family protein [Pseudomonadota bacterium]
MTACKEFFCQRFPYFSPLNILNLLPGCNLISTTRIIRNASLLGVAQAVSMAAGFISTAWVARALGPEGYGVLGFAVAFGSYFALATVFGTDLFGTREIASAPDRAHTLVSRILGARILLLVCAVFLYLLSVWIIDRSQDVTIVLLIQIIVLISSAITIDFLFQAHQCMGPIALRQMGAAMAAMIAAVFLVQNHNDLYIAA